jgi:8-oxo-dGTP pyrophosphatase MutT (NUDIX family)
MPRSFANDPEPWKVLSSVYESRKFWFTVRREELQLPNGTVIPEYWINEYRPWVNVVAVTGNDEVLMVRQYRPGLGAVHFEIPAGTSDPDETDIESACRRELLEETGYGGGRWSPLMTLSANPALQNNLTYTFLAEGVVAMAAPHAEASEDLRLHLVPARDIEGMIEGGELIQALHVAPLLKFLLKRRG